jgi:5-methylcytosine-specific restriction endonuclease McrA
MKRKKVEQPADQSLRTCVGCEKTKLVEGNFNRAPPGQMHDQLRRNRIRTTLCDLTDEQRVSLVEAYGGCCSYCGAIPDDTISIDHVVPICDGGTHSIGNVVPACLYCNLSKNRKALDVFLKLKGFSRTTFDAWRTAALKIVLREVA